MTDVTQILAKIEQGDQFAAEQLLPLVYNELRKLAAAKLAYENPGQTLQATALVHEAYLRLVNAPSGQNWNGRGHFFVAAAEAMRRILVEQARRKNSLKRGGAYARREFHDVEPPRSADEVDLVALDDALARLGEVDPEAARLVHLRYFAGLSMEEAAELLGMSARSAYYLWSYARSWLRRAIAGDSPSKSGAAPPKNLV